MTTKAQILKLADDSVSFVKENSARVLTKERDAESIVIASELARLCDILLDPINTYAREHLEHMPNDTYMRLFHTLGEILEIQETLITYITKGARK